MKKFSDLPLIAQLGIFAALAVAIVACAEFLWFPIGTGTLQDQTAANDAAKAAVDKIRKENDTLKPFEGKLRQLQADNRQSQSQLEALRTIVPVDKDADLFIRMVRDAGDVSGVQVRRFTTMPLSAKEFYVEQPIDIELDGSFSSVMQFFQRVTTLPRIANITNLAMGPVGAGVKDVRRRYDYAPGETILASCLVTTFFRKPEAAAQTAGKK